MALIERLSSDPTSFLGAEIGETRFPIAAAAQLAIVGSLAPKLLRIVFSKEPDRHTFDASIDEKRAAEANLSPLFQGLI